MHGIWFKELKTYVIDEYGKDAWDESLEAAEIEPKLYLPVTEYPDSEAEALLVGICDVTGADRQALLREYGEALAPALLNTFKAHIKTGWDTMDVLERTENQLFDVLKSEDAPDGELSAARPDAGTVVYTYESPLELCSLAKGIVTGIADQNGEPVRISEGSCMLDGASHCEITIERR